MSNLRGLQKSKNLRSIRFCRFDSFNALKGMTRITWSAFYSSVSFREPTQSDQIRINLSYGSVRPSPGFYHGSITEIYFFRFLSEICHIHLDSLHYKIQCYNFLTKYFKVLKPNQPRNPTKTDDFFSLNLTPKNANFDNDVRMDQSTNWNQIFGSNNTYEGMLKILHSSQNHPKNFPGKFPGKHICNNVILILNRTRNVYQV